MVVTYDDFMFKSYPKHSKEVCETRSVAIADLLALTAGKVDLLDVEYWVKLEDVVLYSSSGDLFDFANKLVDDGCLPESVLEKLALI